MTRIKRLLEVLGSIKHVKGALESPSKLRQTFVTPIRPERDFIMKRQKELQEFLAGVLDHQQLAASIHTRNFLDPQSYAVNFQGELILITNVLSTPFF